MDKTKTKWPSISVAVPSTTTRAARAERHHPGGPARQLELEEGGAVQHGGLRWRQIIERSMEGAVMCFFLFPMRGGGVNVGVSTFTPRFLLVLQVGAIFLSHFIV
jgi:hypothetical protein